MSHEILTGPDCQACKDLQRALTALLDVGEDIRWVNIAEETMPCTDKPVRSVPTLVEDGIVKAVGMNDILEYYINEGN